MVVQYGKPCKIQLSEQCREQRARETAALATRSNSARDLVPLIQREDSSAYISAANPGGACALPPLASPKGTPASSLSFQDRARGSQRQ